MAVEHLRGTAITNREATPPVLSNPGQGEGAVEKCAVGHLLSVSAALSAASTIRLVEVPSNAVVTQLMLASGAQGAGAFDVGVYRNVKDGGAVIDADFFATAIAVTTAVALTDITNESGTYTIDRQSQPLWQALGMAADPKTTLDIAVTVQTAVTTGLQPVGLKARYMQ